MRPGKPFLMVGGPLHGNWGLASEDRMGAITVFPVSLPIRASYLTEPGLDELPSMPRAVYQLMRVKDVVVLMYEGR